MVYHAWIMEEAYGKEAGCFYGMTESEIIWKVKNAGGKIEN